MSATTAQIVRYSSLGFILLALALIIAFGQIPAVISLAILPFIGLYFYLLFRYPIIGVYTCLLFSFIANGLSRYIPGPLGLTIDLFLVLTLIATFFKRFDNKNWQEFQNPLVWVALFWVLYCVFEIFNPEVVSYEAWAYAVRSPAFYMLFTLLLGLIYFKDIKEAERLVHLWFAFSVLAALYSFKQFYFGLDAAEKEWLLHNASTHLLFGNLRVFSFYSDAAQFGAAMAHTALAAVILALGKQSFRRRFFYILTAAVCLYAMSLSGTRGALFILLTGGMVYLILCKNYKVLIPGMLILGCAFFLLKFTYVGHSNYQIQRMRSAFNLSDPSFQVRINNQIKLQEYLESRPFGGGIGSAGYWGLRFSPDTFLAKTPVDSWYVKLWAETGVIGITLYLLITLFILIFLAVRLWTFQHSPQRQLLLALFAGLAGITVANYGNQVLGQMPTSLLFYLSIAIIYTLTSASSGKRHLLQ
ncbi:O-antigen ligase family protein [Rhodocytophaga rosea]|uniref:O-antigen ligase family protein n=1 Tax=Rhodocytophaga rosea TaxID=2704465 RepID=A0A6C0GK89_9BACT|nr:O-antigen ligase family protein [Rhodocytophaga rosea]QHT68491.1 O-antigen ligase family protein [Rhodocytophaga rosea]